MLPLLHLLREVLNQAWISLFIRRRIGIRVVCRSTLHNSPLPLCRSDLTARVSCALRCSPHRECVLQRSFPFSDLKKDRRFFRIESRNRLWKTFSLLIFKKDCLTSMDPSVASYSSVVRKIQPNLSVFDNCFCFLPWPFLSMFCTIIALLADFAPSFCSVFGTPRRMPRITRWIRALPSAIAGSKLAGILCQTG